jgi:hypothetical protein
MNHILFEDLGNGLNLTRMVFVRERSLFEQHLFATRRRRAAQRQILNEAVLDFHREREIRERLFEYEVQSSVRLQEIREQIFFNSIPDEFWEPVKITTEKQSFTFEDEEWECLICRQERSKKTQLGCCKQSLCESCVENWFTKESVRCPFCKKDIRELE